MSLKVGIVGLPNVGKSTLFNALLKRQQALVANYPFATIEPNVGVVEVPDERLAKLASVVKTNRIVYATVEFVDIAGLVAGAAEGAGLGNKFLAHIREVDIICHVVRGFTDAIIVKEGCLNPKSDFETVKTELDLADLDSLERREKKKGVVSELPLFSKKPVLVVLNIDEQDIRLAKELEKKYAAELGLEVDTVVAISAKIEAELATLDAADAQAYMEELGIKESGLDKLIRKAYETLGKISFLTAGEIEARAWTLRRGDTALRASGEIHTDFMKKFIKAKVCDYDDFVKYGGWKGVAENGKLRLEGRDYAMADGDVVEFMVGS